MAAKELMSAHGYPERVLIKYTDDELHASMFADDAASPAEVARSAATGDSTCLVCIGSENLIQLPCKHCICEDDFGARFLSDRSQNVYGALPEDQTPSAADDDAARPDFFSCPLCHVPLGLQFWSDFPKHLSQSQRDQPEGLHVTLEHVHHRIVVNTLRVLRQDPLASFARDEPQGNLDSPAVQGSGCYIAAVNVSHAVTCQGQTFGSICDIKNKDHPQNSGQGSDWEKLARKISDENDRASSKSAAGGSSSADAGDLQPVFVSDQERPQTEEGRMMDFRMCPQCFFGNFVNVTCNTMGTHHGEQNTINCCPKCGFFSGKWSEWPKSDDRLHNHR